MDKNHEIEAWALSIIERVKRKKNVEDSRVELKAKFIEPENAARRIAGHANASRGAPILWLIGVDEVNGVVGVDKINFKEWFSKVKGFFNGTYPEVIDILLPVENKEVLCLYFMTNRLPFVVKNPYFGKKNGGPVSLEVPWREATEVNSATRSQLIQILSPLQEVPEIEILDGSIKLYKFESDFTIDLSLSLYISIFESRIQIPFHKCTSYINYGAKVKTIELPNIRLYPPYSHIGLYSKSVSTSITIESTPDEVIINGSGKMLLSANNRRAEEIDKKIKIIKAHVELLPIGFENSINLDFRLHKIQSTDDSRSMYILQKT